MTTGEGARVVAARIDDVVDKAKAQTGLSEFGGDSWRKGLEVLVGAAETEARFNNFGEPSFTGSGRPLVNRLRVEDWYARHPEIDERRSRRTPRRGLPPHRLDRAVPPVGEDRPSATC